MDRARFEAILAAYGADPQRWPAVERGDAEAFAAAHPDIGAATAEAGQLDALLEAGRGLVQGSDLLAARILASFPKAGAAGASNSRGWIVALAACAVFGVALGFGGALLAPQRQSADAALNAAFGESWHETDANGGEG